jgi:uncharacterized RDD family membrane protein YckC
VTAATADATPTIPGAAATPADSTGVPAGRPTATVVSRGLALTVDLLIATILAALLSGVARLFADAINVHFSNGGKPVVVFLLSLPVVFVWYCTIFWWLAGRTLGKQLFGVRVIDRKGNHPGLVRSFVRAVCYGISAIFLIGFVWAAFDRRNQAFHDKIARTFVVYDDAVERS